MPPILAGAGVETGRSGEGQQPLDLGQQLVGVERLGQVAVGAGPLRQLEVTALGRGADDQDRDVLRSAGSPSAWPSARHRPDRA